MFWEGFEHFFGYRSTATLSHMVSQIMYLKSDFLFVEFSWKVSPTPLSLPGEFHGQRSLAGYSSWGHKESDMAEQLSLTKVHLPVSELETFTGFQKTFSCRTCLNFLDFTEYWDSLRRSSSLVHHPAHYSVFLLLSPAVIPLTSWSQPGAAFSFCHGEEACLICYYSGDQLKPTTYSN